VPPENLAPFGRAADALLDDLVASLAGGRAPLPWTPLPDPGERADGVPPLLRGRLSRLERQLRTLHDAVERWERR
jgi:hypothetical protein